jgi:hypothetical protein
VNHLEAMSQWATFSRFKVPFHLYVPVGCVDSARRLCADLQIPAAEVWAYHSVGDQMRFTLVQRSPAAGGDSKAPARKSTPSEAAPRRSVKRESVAAKREPPRPARRHAAASSARPKPAAPKAKAAAPRRAAAPPPGSRRSEPSAKGAKPARKPASRTSRTQKRR